MFLFPNIAEAHVRYIADEATVDSLSGLDFSFLLSALQNPLNVKIISITAVAVFCLVWLIPKIGFLRRKLAFIDSHASSYKDLVPWMARLSLGIALIGAGTSGYLINPVVQTIDFSQIQIIAGFMLLAGFLNVLVVPVVVYLFVVALLRDWYLVGALDVLVLALILFINDSRRPGVDDIIGIPDIKISKWKKYIPIIARVGTGFGLLFLALYEKILNPHLSAFVVEATELTSVVPVSPEMWVLSAGVIEVILGVFLIVGYRVRLVSVITFFVLASSFFYFKEDVSSHITLFGITSILFILGKKHNH